MYQILKHNGLEFIIETQSNFWYRLCYYEDGIQVCPASKVKTGEMLDWKEEIEKTTKKKFIKVTSFSGKKHHSPEGRQWQNNKH